MTKWEYRVYDWSDEYYDEYKQQEKCAKLGDEGWELVSVSYSPIGGKENMSMNREISDRFDLPDRQLLGRWYAYFKREIEPRNSLNEGL